MTQEQSSKSSGGIRVFFSYGHDRHSDIVKRLAKAVERLSDNNITVWIDHKNISRDSHWRTEIANGIRACDSVIAFLSKYSARDKGVCLDEISIALTLKHGMIRTVLLEPADSFTPPAMVAEYQWGDMSDYPQYAGQGEEAFSQYIEKQAQHIIQLVSNEEIKQYNKEVRELRQRLGLPEHDRLTRFDLLLQKEILPRPWLEQCTKQWIEDVGASKILMLYGKPGSGKSAFCAGLQRSDPRVVAAISCDCQSDMFSNTDDIIRYLAYKLAVRLPDYRSNLLYMLRDEQFNIRSGKDLFNDLLVQPLGKDNIDGNRDHMMICIDALDESGTDDLARFISEYHSYMKPWVRFLITARKEPHILQRFENCCSVDLDDCADKTQEDLLVYYHNRLDNRLSDYADRDEFINKLVLSSENVFTYAECVCNNILDDIEHRQIEDLLMYPVPKGIQSLFEITLDRKFNSPSAQYTKQDFEEFWQEPLGMIIASPDPLPVSTLKQLMGWRNSKLQKFRNCLSTMLTETEGCLQVFHRSFGEWLDCEASPYYTSTEDGTECLAELCYEQYKSEPDEADEYILLHLTKLLREAGMRKEYNQLTEDKDFIARLFSKENDFRKSGRFNDALALCREIVTLFKNADIKDEWKSDNLSGAYFCMGRSLKTLNRFDEAIKNFQCTLDIHKKQIESSPKNPHYQNAFANTLSTVAVILHEQNRIDEAEKMLDESIAISKLLVSSLPDTPEFMYVYAVTLERRADICKTQNKADDALLLYNQSIKVSERLLSLYTDNLNYMYLYSSASGSAATLHMLKGDYGEALKLYLKSLNINSRLVQLYPDNTEYLYKYSVSLDMTASFYRKQNNLRDAAPLYMESMTVSKKLADKHPENPGYKLRYSGAVKMVADIHRIQNNTAEALALYKECLSIDRELSRAYPENPVYLDNYCVTLDKTATALYLQKDFTEALKLYQESMLIYKGLTDKYPDSYDYLDKYSVLLINVAKALEVMQQPDKALEQYKKYHKVVAGLIKLRPDDPEHINRYYISLENAADICAGQKNYSEAMELYGKSLEISQQLTQANSMDVRYMMNFSVTLTKMADIDIARDKLSDGFELLLGIISFHKDMVDSYPEKIECLALYFATLLRLSNLCAVMRKREEYIHYLTIAKEVCLKLSQIHPNKARYQGQLSAIEKALSQI